MSNIFNLIKIPTKIILDESNKKVDEETQKLIDMGILEKEIDDDNLTVKDANYYFDPTKGIHEIRETYIPLKDEFEKVIIVTFSEGYIQTPPLFIESEELMNLILEKRQ